MSRVMLSHDFKARRVQLSVTDKDARLTKFEIFSESISHLAAGLFDDQSSGSEIPRLELVLEEGTKQSVGDLAKVERSGAKTANAVDVLFEEIMHSSQSRFHHGATVVIEPAAHHDFV